MTKTETDFSSRIPITILLVAAYFLIGVFGILYLFTPPSDLKVRTLVVLTAAPFALASISILVAPFSVGPEKIGRIAIITLPLICLIWDVCVSLLFALPVGSLQVHQNIDIEYAKLNLGWLNVVAKFLIGAGITYLTVSLPSKNSNR